MLSKQQKLDLRNTKNFFLDCKKKNTPLFSLFYQKNNERGLKIAVIVPKKTIKLASQRNDLKRFFYSLCEDLSETVKNKNLNLVIIINRNPPESKKKQLSSLLESSLIEIKS